MSQNEELYDDCYYQSLPTNSGRIGRLKALLEFGDEDSVCEIGCASGDFLAAIAPLIQYGIGLDISEPAIRAANTLKHTQGLANIEFEEVSAGDFVLRDGNAARFDYVLLLDVTEHIDDATVADVLESAKRLLKPSGRLVIHTPNLAYWIELLKDKGITKQVHGHIAVRNEEQYCALIDEAGFGKPRVFGLPHYRQPLRFVDQLLSRVPLLGRLFCARLFIVVSAPSGAHR
jgi:2-polyprenyl-3-methyl-5-hydroxy-6-metoxy-1,4-benzoquinol methylase